MRTGPPQHPTGLRAEHALPLADERTWGEQTIETKVVVSTLATKRGLAALKDDLDRLADGLRDAHESGDDHAVRVRWNEACEFLYKWDAATQDTLAASSFTVASAYQLGRGLAEIYWALDPSVSPADDPRSARFLLGADRLQAFGRLLPRLTAYFSPATTPAIQASLMAWAQVASNDLFRDRYDVRSPPVFPIA